MYYLEYLKKYLWVAKIVAVMLSAFLLANAVSIFIRGRWSSAPTVDVSKNVAAAAAYVPLNNYEMIVKRSLFNSPGMNMEGGFSAAEQGPVIGVDDFQLLGVIAGLPELSLAVINTKHDGQTGVFKVDDLIAGQYKVLDIRSKEVEIDYNGSPKIIQLPDTEGTNLLAGRWNRGAGSDVADGIKKLGEGDFVVDKGVIDDAFQNMGSLMRGARIVPEMKDGKIVGFKVFRIRKNSLYGQIGLQNGDVIHRVNSVEIKGPEDGLRIFGELKSAKNISIDITRGGARQSLSYQVK